MSEKIKYIELDGEKHMIPSYVKNIDVFKEYKKKHQEFLNNPKRTFKFNNGKEIKLPTPNLKNILIANDATKEEKSEITILSTQFRKEQGLLTSLKKKCSSESGNRYGTSIKKDLLEEYGPLMLELFEDFKSPFEVHKIFVKRGIELNYNSISKFFHQNGSRIRERRIAVKEGFDDLSVGVKRSRLEKLDYMLNDLYVDYNSSTGLTKIAYSKEIRGIIEQARKEVEGEELKLTVNGRIDIQATIELSVKKTNLIQNLTIAQMVMARICNRSNGSLSYNQMVNRLAFSFYSQFNGFRVSDQLQEVPMYPSQITYDILELEETYEKAQRIEKERDLKIEESISYDESFKYREFLQKFTQSNKSENE